MVTTCLFILKCAYSADVKSKLTSSRTVEERKLKFAQIGVARQQECKTKRLLLFTASC